MVSPEKSTCSVNNWLCESLRVTVVKLKVEITSLGGGQINIVNVNFRPKYNYLKLISEFNGNN